MLIISLPPLLWDLLPYQMLCPMPAVVYPTLHIDCREKAEILRQIRPLWIPYSTHIFKEELVWNWQMWGLRASEDQKCQMGSLEDKELSPSKPIWKSIVKVASSVLAGNQGQNFWTALNMGLFWVLSPVSLVLTPPSNTSSVSRNRFTYSIAQTYSQAKKWSVL